MRVDGPILFRNDEATGSWLRVRAVERGSARDSHGAKVVVEVRGDDGVVRRQTRSIGSESAFLGTSERVAHFGLGEQQEVARVTVSWPGTDSTVELTNVPCGITLVVTAPAAGRQELAGSFLTRCDVADGAMEVTQPALGSAVLQRDSSVLYTPGAAGLDEFSYRVRDANGDVHSATVQVLVDGSGEAGGTRQTARELAKRATQHAAGALASAKTALSGAVAQLFAPAEEVDGEWLQTLEMFEREVPELGETYSIDGTGNNKDHPEWGKAGSPLLRDIPAAYEDGASAPPTQGRPSTRAVSNAVGAQHEPVYSERGLSDLVMHLGQLLSHDLSHTTPIPHNARHSNFFIDVPRADPIFDPDDEGGANIRFKRSIFDPSTGQDKGTPRQQINTVTAWMDGSFIYGSDEDRKQAVAGADGRMDTGENDTLPCNKGGAPNDNPLGRKTTALLLSGDRRTNIQPGLFLLHTIFVREHNRVAEKIAEISPQRSVDDVFARARAFVTAELQALYIEDYMAVLLGEGRIARYSGLKSDVNPGVSNFFSTAAFRFGHSQTNEMLPRRDESNRAIPSLPDLSLRDVYFRPDLIGTDNDNYDALLRGVLGARAQRVDTLFNDAVRNFLFGAGQTQQGIGGVDLSALNMQRGRDHGLPDYNSAREGYGLARVESFEQITSNSSVAAALRDVYGGQLDKVDAYIGGLAEDHEEGSELGPLFTTAMANQLTRTRDGDRFWYERRYPAALVERLRATRVGQLLERNTGLTGLRRARSVLFLEEEGS